MRAISACGNCGDAASTTRDGRRDNINKGPHQDFGASRFGPKRCAAGVSGNSEEIRKTVRLQIAAGRDRAHCRHFAPPLFEDLPDESAEFEHAKKSDAGFADWAKTKCACS